MKAAIHFDGLISQNLTGWASAGDLDEREGAEAAHLPIELRIGHEIVAVCTRGSHHAKAGLKMGSAAVLRGFVMPFIPAVIYTALLGRGSLADLSISFQDVALSAQSMAPVLREIGEFRPLVLHEHADVRISDVWFTTGNQLRLRVNVTDTTKLNAPKFTFYQCDEDKKTTAMPISRHSIERHGINFISVDLLNPYLPLLITLSDADGKVPLIDILPFPSLCKGGNHFAELQSLGMTGRYLDNLRTVSDSLVREHLGWEGAPMPSIGKIAVNIDGATGAEVIFSKDVRDWINRMFDVAIAVEHSEANRVRDGELERHLVGEAATAAASEHERLTLHIPHDSLPTISSLATRRLRLSPGLPQKSGPFVTADLRSRVPRWLVSMPALPSWLNELQPQDSARFYPVVSCTAGVIQESETNPLPADVPLIVRYIPNVEFEEAGRILPTARDVDRALLRSSTIQTTKPRSVSVLVSTTDGHLTSLANLTNSLAIQSLHEALEIIVISHRSPPHFEEAATRLLGEAFPNRNRIVNSDASSNQSSQINFGAKQATGDFLVIVSDGVVFLDPRTIEVLLTLADRRDVGSSSCLLLRDKGESNSALSFHSAGLFPSELSLLGRPYMSFDHINCESVLANATYPVVANSLALCAVRTENWQMLGGLDATQFPQEGSDLDYGLRALAKGLIHLCTTGVAAYCDHRASSAAVKDTHSTRYLTRFPLDRLLDSCTVVRKLDG